MMVSEQARNLQPVAMPNGSSASSQSGASPSATDAAIAFPPALADAATMDPSVFAALPFEEQLASLQSDPASFFIDTAAIAQQIAASVTDEKKLSDNILDLIPPPQPASAMEASAADAAAAFALPLGPPPGLMDMRALSPPMNLLPDFTNAMPTLALDAAAALTGASSSNSTASAATTSTTTAAATTVTAPTTAEDRRKAAFAAASVLKKRKSSDAFATDAPATATVSATAASTAAISAATTAAAAATLGSSTPASSTTPSAATLQTLAREKVMKEPQSGDLYECVITKRNGGLGLTLACVDDHVQITGLAPDTPAANSGICVGDTLVAVSGLPVRGLQFSTVIGRLKSSSRNSVVLKLRRNPFRHNGAGNGLPYRAANGAGMGLKRPARPTAKTPESNSANVLSSSKSMALETRLAGPGGVNHAQSLVDSASSSSSSTSSHTAFHIKTEPSVSVYFDRPTSLGESATSAQPEWRVAQEDRDRYYAEARRLRHELAHAMAWRRRERSAQDALHQQFQAIAHKFESEMQTVFQIGDSSSAVSHHEDLVALRQKLLEVNHALARQQTEILELKERDARHAFHELRRVKAEIVASIQKQMHDLVMTGASQLSGGSEPASKACEERLEGVRSSVFEHLFQQQSTAAVAAKLLAARHHRPASLLASATAIGAVKEEKSASIELELDATQTMQVLSWNLRERLPARALVVRIAGGCQVEYVTHDEALTLRYRLELLEEKPAL